MAVCVHILSCSIYCRNKCCYNTLVIDLNVLLLYGSVLCGLTVDNLFYVQVYLFDDFSSGGTLCHIMATAYRVKTEQLW